MRRHISEELWKEVSRTCGTPFDVANNKVCCFPDQVIQPPDYSNQSFFFVQDIFQGPLRKRKKSINSKDEFGDVFVVFSLLF
jgi:hypothetical protein